MVFEPGTCISTISIASHIIAISGFIHCGWFWLKLHEFVKLITLFFYKCLLCDISHPTRDKCG